MGVNPCQEEAKYILEQIIFELGPQNLNTLGCYEHLVNGKVVDESPAAKINYPLNKSQGVVVRMKPDSGIEAIVESEPQSELKLYRNYNVSSTRKWLITLSQYKKTGNLTDSLDHLYSVPQLSPIDQPVIYYGYELADGKGTIPPRALIYIPAYGFIRNNFRSPVYP